jgi:toxin-antitoxin system PIN domain toxin
VPGSLFDLNVWIAAIFPTHAFHRQARAALEAATVASPAVFCRSTQLSLLRLTSNPALWQAYGAEKLTNNDALAVFNALCALPQVCERAEAPGTVELWHRLAASATASPKVWMDAYLAAYAISGAMRLVTLDHDFKIYEQKGLDLVLLDRAAG